MTSSDFPRGPYNVIYADPPWSFRNKKTGGSMKSGAASQYNTMRVYDICRMPVETLAADNCVLLMWWVASQPEEALKVMDAWGFKLKTMTGFLWNKLTKTSKPHFGMGHWTRAGSESCLLAVKGNPKPVSRSVRSVRSLPVLGHSKKPDEFADDAVELCGDVPRIELFARDRKPGWESWGKEIGTV